MAAMHRLRTSWVQAECPGNYVLEEHGLRPNAQNSFRHHVVLSATKMWQAMQECDANVAGATVYASLECKHQPNHRIRDNATTKKKSTLQLILTVQAEHYCTWTILQWRICWPSDVSDVKIDWTTHMRYFDALT